MVWEPADLFWVEPLIYLSQLNPRFSGCVDVGTGQGGNMSYRFCAKFTAI